MFLRNLVYLPVAVAILIALWGTAQVQAQDKQDPLEKQKVIEIAEELLNQHKVPGIAIARIYDGKLMWIARVGYADLDAKTPIGEDTVFNVGSVSKCVAAWGFMRLVSDGKLDLDSPVEDYLKEWRFPDSDFNSDHVTLRRVLSHTAGLSLHGYPGFQSGEELPTLEESLSGATNGRGDVRIVYEPGSKMQYSGGGYTIAQLMLEDQTDTSFADYMRQEVFSPLGMESSDYGWTERVSKNAARPHDEDGKPIEVEHFTALAAAGLQTTIEDLAKFAIASLATKDVALAGVLTVDQLKTMQTPVQPMAKGITCGLGYQHRSLGGFKVMGHTGSNTGWQAAVFLKPENREGLIMLTNGSNGRSVMQPIVFEWARANGTPIGGR